MTASDTVACPVCEQPVPVGLPRDADLVDVRAGSDGDEPFDPMETPPTDRSAELRCENGHAVTAYFRVTDVEDGIGDPSLSGPGS